MSGCIGIIGPRTWSLSVDKDDFRTYKLKVLVQMAGSDQGPYSALQVPGLPKYGDPWLFDSDFDPRVTCRRPTTVTPILQNEPNLFFEIEYTFSNEPDDWCQVLERQDPCQMPPKISGTFSRYQEEAAIDLNGQPIRNSALEQFRGPQVEFDHNRPSIKIEVNVCQFQFALICQMVDTVNDAPLWGFAPRQVKLTNCSWQKKCDGYAGVYFSMTLEFEVSVDGQFVSNGWFTPAPQFLPGTAIPNPLAAYLANASPPGWYEQSLTDGSGWDRVLLDQGTRVLHGDWQRNRFDVPTGLWVNLSINGHPPNPLNPADYMRFKDYNGENAPVVLDGAGNPAGANVPNGTVSPAPSQPGRIVVQYYPESNFLQITKLPADLFGANFTS